MPTYAELPLVLPVCYHRYHPLPTHPSPPLLLPALQLAAAVGPEMLAKYRATRQGAAAAARLQLPRTKGGRLKASVSGVVLNFLLWDVASSHWKSSLA